MKSKVYYKEEQKMDVWWVKLLIIAVVLYSLGHIYYGLIQQLANGISWGDNPVSDRSLVILALIVTLILGGVLFLVFGSKLITEIKPDGIHLRYFPFFRDRFISKESIERFEVRKYKPIIEYGGYGLRYSIRNGRAYNMSGNTGLQLYLVSGNKVLIGTRRPDAIKRAMEKLMNER